MATIFTKVRLPATRLPLDDDNDDVHIPADVIAVLTDFQVDAIRFLLTNRMRNKSCIYNDGSHMGKRITLAALISALIRTDRILIACDEDEAIVSWMHKLHLFIQKPQYKVHAGTRYTRDTGSSPITFVNFRNPNVDWMKLSSDNGITFTVLDLGSATDDLKFLDSLSSFTTVVCSADVRTASIKLLGGFKVLRRTKEENLREFPWLDQKLFQEEFRKWKRSRSNNEMLCGVVEDADEWEESQQLDNLLVDTEDEVTPVKQDVGPIPSHQSHLNNSMYLRVSDSFAGSSTPKPSLIRFVKPETHQDSPDLFASFLDSATEEDDPLNPFDVSSPSSPNGNKRLHVPSQSPIEAPLCPEINDTQQDVFEITTNEVFASKIKITTSQKIVPFEESTDHLKFTDEPRTPTTGGTTARRNKIVSPQTPSSSGWLSKRGAVKRSPEKVLIKKRKSLAQFYTSSGESGGNFDFSSIEDEETQRWTACPTKARATKSYQVRDD